MFQVILARMSRPHSVFDWLERPLGQTLLAAETEIAEQCLSQVFGFQAVQVGRWGNADQFSRSSRTSRYTVLSHHEGDGVDLVSPADELALASASVDAVILPHTLETEDDPHEVLREAERVLSGEGHLLIFSFNPNSLWGIRHRLSRGRFPPGIGRLVSEHRLRDWMRLLGFEVLSVTGYCAGPPTSAPAWLRESKLNKPAGNGALKLIAGAYCLLACKRVYTGTRVMPGTKRKPRVLAGLAEPSTRNST